ncbi:MAG: cobalamin biosynthesis protein P47K, partial [Gemmataceae bacterium]
ADAILLNRIDELPAEELDELSELVLQRYPGVPLLKVSARTGQGFDSVLALLDQEGDFGRKILDIDYDVYAEGEAELGWLNSSVHVQAPSPFEVDALMLEIIQGLRDSLVRQQAEVAHLKVIGLAEGGFGVANLVSSLTQPELSLPSHQKLTETDVIVNARVAMDPAQLEVEVQRVVKQASVRRGGQAEFRKTQSLRPGRPTPTHRYASAVK